MRRTVAGAGVVAVLVVVGVVATSVLFGCDLQALSPFVRDNPVDPEAEGYAGYHTVEDANEVEAHTEDEQEMMWPQFVVSKLLGAEAYHLQIAKASEFTAESLVHDHEEYESNEMRPAGDVGLESDRRYYWRARARGSGEYGSWTAVRSFIAVGVMTEMSPADGATVEKMRPEFGWDAVEGAVGYEVQIAGTELDIETAEIATSDTEAYTPVEALENDQTHYWRVRAVDANDQRTGWSATYSITIGWGAISGKSPADGSLTLDTRPTLSWDAVDGAIGYEVQAASSEGGVSEASAIETTATTVEFPFDLEKGDTGYWRVRATDGEVYGAWSNVWSVIAFSDFTIAVSDYASPDGNSSHFWRGYRFEVSVAVSVNYLSGSATAAGFLVGLYAADGNTPIGLLGWGALSGGMRGEQVPIGTIDLEPGKEYIIAQGRASGSGSHFRVNPINVAALVSEEMVIQHWEPSAGDSLSFGTAGDQDVIVGRTGGTNLTRPELGFGFAFQ